MPKHIKRGQCVYESTSSKFSAFFFTASWKKYADPFVQLGLAQNGLATIPPSCGRFDNLHIGACAAAYVSRPRPRRRSLHYLGKATGEGPSSSGEIELQISLSSRRDPWNEDGLQTASIFRWAHHKHRVNITHFNAR